MIALFKQRDIGDKINATFQYITENFRTLGVALFYIVGPVALATGILTGIMQSNALRIVGESANARTTNPFAVFQVMSQLFSPVFWFSILFSILANVVVVLVTCTHMKLYAQRTTPTSGPPSITVAEIWADVQPMIGRGIVISILSSTIVGVAMMFFIFPGIYVAIVLSLALTVTSFEETNFGQTWERCFKLIRDKWWSTFGLIVIVSIIVFIIGLVFAIPGGIIAFLISAKLLPDVSTVWLILGNVINVVGRTILNAVIYVAIGFQYTNLVERQEGRGLLSAIDSIGTTTTQPRAQDEGDY